MQDVNHSSPTQHFHLGTNYHLLKTDDRVMCETRRIANICDNSGLDFQNHLPTEQHLAKVTQQATEQDIMSVKCNKKVSDNIYENI